jgi:hypothetical protein
VRRASQNGIQTESLPEALNLYSVSMGVTV